MVRYGFFIVSSFFSNSSVSAVSRPNDNISIAGERYFAINSDIGSSDQNSLPNDQVDNGQTDQNAFNGQTPEEIRSEIGLKSPEDFDENGELLITPILPLAPDITVDENAPESNDDRGANGWQYGLSPLITPYAINWAGYPGTVRSGPNNGYYITGYFKGWNLAGTMNFGMVANNIDMITMQARKSFAALEHNETQLGAEINNNKRAADNRMNNIDAGWTNAINTLRNTVTQRMNNIDAGWSTAVKNLQNNINANSRRMDNIDNGWTTAVKNLQNNINANSRRMDNIDIGWTTAVKNLQNNINANSRRMDNIDSFITSSVKNLQNNINANSKRMDNIDSFITSSVKNLQNNINANTKRMDNIDSFIITSVGNLQKNIDAEASARNRADQELERKIKNLNFSDAGIVASLLGVKGSIDEFKEFFRIADPESYDIVEGDGDFIQILKMLFKHLEDTLRFYFGVDFKGNVTGSFTKFLEKQFEENLDVFRRYYEVGENKDKPTGIFSGFLADLFYKLRYTIIQEFDELMTDLTDVYASMLGSLNTVNQYLDLIAKKQYGNVTVNGQPFDYDRLERILSGLQFDGENNGGWLKTLIQTLGEILKAAIEGGFEVIGTAIKTVGSLIERILDFLDSLLDKIIKLLVPENLDFIEKEFEGTSTTFKKKFDFIFSGIDGFKSLFNGSKNKFADYKLDISFMGTADSVTVPVSLINDYAPVVKPFVTGLLVLSFIINMYKWFYTRGEVVD
jgi:hypothetical protein